jgi:hypothetical protein
MLSSPKLALTILASLILAVATSQSLVFAQGQGKGGSGNPGGGGPPPGKGGGGGETETAANNLSYPATFTADKPTLQGTAGLYNLGTADVNPGVSWSYGCNKPETIGTTTYPNTSCVNAATGMFLTFSECQAVCGTIPVERIYWQKTSANVWQAASEGPTAGPRNVAFLNWGDNLETGQWTATSTIRVETTPFSLLSGSTLLGFQMWHVSGQGTNELWGVRATGPDYDPAITIAPYIYNSPYTIVHTSSARLNFGLLAQLPPGQTCGNPPPPSPLKGSGTWQTSPARWGEALATVDVAYTPELNIGGKFVYGYNWKVRSMTLPPGLTPAGWWRLTFYTTDGSVNFLSQAPLTEPDATYTYYPYVPSPTSAIAPRADTGPKYLATVDTGNNLTYIDICLNSSTGGGRR